MKQRKMQPYIDVLHEVVTFLLLNLIAKIYIVICNISIYFQTFGIPVSTAMLSHVHANGLYVFVSLLHRALT